MLSISKSLRQGALTTFPVMVKKYAIYNYFVLFEL